jgi:hypothetical protein
VGVVDLVGAELLREGLVEDRRQLAAGDDAARLNCREMVMTTLFPVLSTTDTSRTMS